MQKVELVDIIEKPISGEWGEDDYVGNGKFVLRTTNFTNEGVINYSNVVTRAINKTHLENKYLRDGDILIEKSGGSDKQPVGRVVYFDGKPNTYLFNNFTSLLRVREKEASKRYVFYFLFYNYLNGKTRAFQNKTTGLHNLKLEPYLRSLKLLLPPIEEQKAIAEKLDKVSILIEKRKQQLSLLDTLVKSKFVEMFSAKNRSDFDVVPLHKAAKKIFAGGDKPKKLVTIKDDVFKYPVYANGYENEGLQGYSCDYKVDEYAITISARGTIGYCFIRSPYFIPVVRLITIVPNEKSNIVYLKCALQNLDFKASGTSQAQLTVPLIMQEHIVLPPIQLQNQFADFVKQTEKAKAKIKQSLAALELLKKSLMQKYFGSVD